MESYLRTGSESREDGAAFNDAGKALALELLARAERREGKPASDLGEDSPDESPYLPFTTDYIE